MLVSEPKYENTVTVLLFDPIRLIEDLSLDRIREQCRYEMVTSIGDQVVLFQSTSENVKGSIQSSRLEFTDQSTSDSAETGVRKLRKLLDSLPCLHVRAIGVNLCLRGLIASDGSGGGFIRDAFVRNGECLGGKLDRPLISASVRLFYGSPEEYYDLRLTPVAMTGGDVGIQLHYHKDVSVQDTELVFATVEQMHKDCVAALQRVLTLDPQSLGR